MSTEHNGYGVSGETFQAIIQERKAEKNRRAREERAKILKSIMEGKSRSGVDPLEQFPKEVWEMVLDELSEPKDLCNVSQVHGVFQDLLGKRKIRDMLFPQVLGLHIQTNPDPHAEILPLARDLNMRLVSKSMRDGIDRWYEDNLLRCLRTAKNFVGDEVLTVDLEFVVFKFNKLLKNFRSSSLNSEEPKATRFLQRSLRTTLATENADEIRSLLGVIGDQVWHFFVDIDDEIDLLGNGEITFQRIYGTLVEWAELMPNLKWLQLDITGGFDYPEQRKGVSIAPYIASHPFPNLVHLERVDVQLWIKSIELTEMYEAIFSANRHLKRLHIRGFKDELLESVPTAILDSLEAFCVGDEWDHCFNWRFIRPLFVFQWPLKQIHLGIEDEDVVSFPNVLEFLENFQTLEHVNLNFRKVRITGDLKFLELPNLTEFEIKFFPIIDFKSGRTVKFFFSLQFLLHCKKLKKLRWGYEIQTWDDWMLLDFVTTAECQKRMIDFRAGHRNLNHSNIWDVFPYLDLITIDLVEESPPQIMKFRRIERDSTNDQYLRYRSWWK